MKKTLYIAMLSFISTFAYSQAWIEAFVPYSIPLDDFTSDETDRIVVGDYYFDVENKYLFRTFANPSAGGGVSFRYVKNQFVVGIEASYVEYNERTELIKLTMFRIGPTFEYFFMPDSKFHPYVGAEFGMINPKVFYNSDIISKSEISRTFIGGGLRAGATYSITEKWALRLGMKYMLVETLPYADISLGIAYNLGDF